MLLEDYTWSTRYIIPENDRYSDLSTHWTPFSINFTVEKFGIKIIYDEIDSGHADMCFSDITMTHSVYSMIYEKFFKDMLESMPDCRKILLLVFLIENDVDLLNEYGYLKNDTNRLNLEFKNVLIEQNEEFLDYIKNEEESIGEKFLYK